MIILNTNIKIEYFITDREIVAFTYLLHTISNIAEWVKNMFYLKTS